MKTGETIDSLSKELKISDKNFYRNSLLMWLTGTALLLGLFFYSIPLRPDLVDNLKSAFFQVETAVIVALFFISSWLAYRSSVPGLLGSQEQVLGWILIGLFVIFLISRITVAGFYTEFQGEMDFYRGRCGPIFLIFAGLQTGLGLVMARRGAPTRLFRAGFWIGMSSSALGLFALQMICDHDNFLHLLVWHATPVALLVGATSAISGRLLRW